MWRILLSVVVCLLPLAAPAQEGDVERDRGFLTGLLEESLSGAGRDVRIDGFAGALSSRATFSALSVADDAGVWFTIKNGAISWNRAALLAGRIEIAELFAEEIHLLRRPQPALEGGLPAPEVTPFALPALPVSVTVGKIAANTVTLDQSVFGAAASVSLSGSLGLIDGEGQTELAIERIDGTRGSLFVSASYANSTRFLALNLALEEEENGIAANLIGLPGRPEIALSIRGEGRIDDFSAEIELSSSGAPRIWGTVALRAADEDLTGSAQTFRAALSGDIAPLLPREYQEFFGESSELLAEGQRKPSGGFSLSTLLIQSQAMRLAGSVELLPTWLPERAAVTLTLSPPSGEDVLLPLAGEKTWLRGATLALNYERAIADGWRLEGLVEGVRRGGTEIETLELSGSGLIQQPADLPASISGTLSYVADGIILSDPALGAAIGNRLAGGTAFFWQENQPLKLDDLTIAARDVVLSGELLVSAPERELTVSGAIDLSHGNIAHLSGLAARPLSGAVSGSVTGSYSPLSGGFDLDAALNGTGIHVSQPDLDRLMTDSVQISTSARRDISGITIRSARLVAGGFSGEAQGVLRTNASDIALSFEFTDLAALGRGWSGGIGGQTHWLETQDGWRGSLDGLGDDLRVGQAEIDRVLAGKTSLNIIVQETESGFRLEGMSLKNTQFETSASGEILAGRGRLEVAAQLRDTALIAPGFTGPLTFSGLVESEEGAYELTLSGSGPGNTRAAVSGSISAGFEQLNLVIAGDAEAALANAFIAPRSVRGAVSFDLRVVGSPELGSVSGQISTREARIVDPLLGVSLQNVSITANLASSVASLTGSAGLSTGGNLLLSGAAALTAPHTADLAVTLDRLVLRDPDLYDAVLSGALALNGPLLGGAIISGGLELGQTELRIPSDWSTTPGAIAAITHVSEPSDVRATRARAGLLDEANGQASAPPLFGLNLRITAPRQIFVRGRGIDAELGGELQIGGTTAAVQPIGQFDLIRGRVDILGKRFTLNEGLVQLQGGFMPWLRFVATTSQDLTSTTITIEGEAREPELRFSASPELPEEEVLSRLLFGRSLDKLSPIQAAQLASAVATLAGRGGEGIIAKLRSATGLDDLDITTDTEGTATLRAGRYLSENLYSDFTVDSSGKTEINLNLDITPNLTARGTLGSDGKTGIGLYFERDY